MNHIKLFTLSLAALAAIGAGAETLTPEQALARLGRSRAVMPKALNGGTAALRLAHTVADPEGGEQALYVFTPKSGEGYIIVSADDRAVPLLGYTESGSFDDATLPAPTRWWLGEYAREISHARGTRSLATAVERPEREAIAPMVTTTWNQDAPYNALCPEYNGSHSMTGCVATAMAQIVNYHEWPLVGVGSHQYYYKGEWISLDFSQITYDWANMLDSYAGDAGNERQKIAVARLMQACGVSTDMQYSTSESGTPDVYVASALVDYFNYDRNIRYAERDYFGMLEWEEFIYSQLRDYGPVQYSGSSSEGGHSFVCDGYSSDGFFHINWGWGGKSDGYFRLSALDPPSQGIGGSSSGFNYSQAVIANIRKPRSTSKMYLNLMMDQGFSVAAKSSIGARPGDQIAVGNRVLNYSTGTANGAMGVKFVNDETGEEKYSTASTRISIQSLGYIDSYTAQIPSTLKAGTYTLSPVMCGTDGVWKDVPVKLSSTQKVKMTIKNGSCTFEDAATASCRADNVELLTEVYLGNLFRLKADITNTGDMEFVGTLVPTLASGNAPIAKADPVQIDLLPGENMELEYTGIFNHFATTQLPAPGTYTLYMVKEATNEIVSAGMEIELHGVPENTKLKQESFGVVGDPKKVDRENVEFSGRLTCEEGYFGRSLSVVLFPYTTGNVSAIGFFNTANIFMAAGESADIKASGAFAAGEPGKTYFAVLYDGQTAITPGGSEVVFTLDNTSGIEAVESDDSVVATSVYNLAGSLVREAKGEADLADLPAGVYIVETVTASGRRSATRRAIR